MTWKKVDSGEIKALATVSCMALRTLNKKDPKAAKVLVRELAKELWMCNTFYVLQDLMKRKGLEFLRKEVERVGDGLLRREEVKILEKVRKRGRQG